jgi:predicted O-linked N-acetylglucosamine transferase (SPINDLY family)
LQVTWLAYPGTTGVAAIDYRLTDPYLDPPGTNDEFYAEKSIRFSNTFWCYDPLTSEPTVNALPADRDGRITFGSLNTFCKVNDPTLQLWSQVLNALPDSRLLLLAPEGSPRGHVVEQLNVPADRVEFIDRQPRLKYLELYHRIDIGLDTFPYNGHTTSLDGLWMGVPTVSLYGQTAVSRAGLSQASNLGLTELVTPDCGQFVEIAKQLAGDRAHLRQVRATLRDRMTASPLMDGARFARDVEAAYRAMWRGWCSEDKVTRNERDDA